MSSIINGLQWGKKKFSESEILKNQDFWKHLAIKENKTPITLKEGNIFLFSISGKVTAPILFCFVFQTIFT